MKRVLHELENLRYVCSICQRKLDIRSVYRYILIQLAHLHTFLLYLAQMFGAGAGLLFGAGLMSWYPDPYRFDFKGTVVPKTLGLPYLIAGLRSPTLWASLICGTFSGVECIMEQTRDESRSSTYVNSAVAGAVTGAMIGSMTKRLDVMSSTALCLGMLMGMVEYNGSKVAADVEHVKAKNIPLPVRHAESSELDSLKETYPEFKQL
jgi:prepilin signal peptidase PulO-like enzyme (type II secretory pathway)